MFALSIVIPCYNEENNLKRGVLKEVNRFLLKQKFSWEVLICNDESTDNSLSILRKFSRKHSKFRVLNLSHKGKPGAVWSGIKEAKYPFVLFTDMDQSTPLKEINKIIPYFNQNYDVVIGSRGSRRNGNSLLRKLMAQTFLFFRRLVLLPNIIDTQCGFKAIKTDLAKIIFPRLQFFKDTTTNSGWRVSAFDVELLFMAQKLGAKIKEVEIEWKNRDTSTTKGDDTARFKKESLQMLSEIYRVKLNDLRGFYDQT
jgi:glycosyltransferase involved in cell wall biosynthesis